MRWLSSVAAVQGVYHSAGFGGPWYGSDNVIDLVRDAPSWLWHWVIRLFDLRVSYGESFLLPALNLWLVSYLVT